MYVNAIKQEKYWLLAHSQGTHFYNINVTFERTSAGKECTERLPYEEEDDDDKLLEAATVGVYEGVEEGAVGAGDFLLKLEDDGAEAFPENLDPVIAVDLLSSSQSRNELLVVGITLYSRLCLDDPWLFAFSPVPTSDVLTLLLL